MPRKDKISFIKGIKQTFSRKTKDKIWPEDSTLLRECNDDIEASELDSATLFQEQCFGNEKGSGRAYEGQAETSSQRVQDNAESESDDDITSDCESGYRTIPNNDILDEQAADKFIHPLSVPTRYSKGKLEDEKQESLRHVTIIKVKDSKEFQITGDGHAHFSKKSSQTGTTNDSRISDRATRSIQVEARTLRTLNNVRQTEPKVETELFNGARELIKRISHYPLAILMGSGSGCGFAAKMLFEDLLSNDIDAKGYVLRDAEETSVINDTEQSVLLILDANGPTGSDMKRLDGWYETLKERMPMGHSDRGTLQIIMVLNESRTHPILHKYSEYIVDAFEKRYRPADETKDKLIDALVKQNNIRIRPIKCGSPLQDCGKMGKLSIIDKETVNGIVPLLGSTGCIGKLSDFFRSNLSQGLNFFRQPIPKHVRHIRELYKEGSRLFLVLLAVHAHGGQLGVGRVHQMRTLNAHTEKFWYSMDNINTKSKQKSKMIKRICGSVELQLLYRFAKDNGLLTNIGNIIHKCASQLNGMFLEEINDVFRFSNGHIYYSFLLVCCEVYPIALHNCKGAFFFNFVKSRKDSLTKETDMFLVVDDTKLKNTRTRAVMTRVKTEMMLRHVSKCMKLQFMDTCFFTLFVKYLKETPHLLWTVLIKLDNDPKEAYSCLYHGIGGPVESLKGVPRNVSEVVLLLDVWAKKRRKPKWREWVRTQMNESLIHAAELSNDQTVSLLIERGAEKHVDALEKAMDARAANVIEIILEKGKLSQREWSHAALHAINILSSGHSSDQLLHALKAVLVKTDVNVAIDSMQPLIHRIVKEKNAKMLSMLIEGDMTNVPININVTFDRETALTIATRLGFKDIVAILLKHNASQNMSDVMTRPIYIAASEGYDDVLKLLIAENSDIIYDMDSDGLIPLFHAVSNDQLSTVQAILSQSGVQAQNSKLQVLETNRNGQTSLHVASELGYKEIIHVMLEHGADVSLRDNHNETPLSLACRGKHTSAVRVILNQWNIKKHMVDERAVMRAVQDGDTELVQLLSEYGFGVNFVNSEYGVPLLVAIQYGMHDMVRCILSNGGNPNIEQNGHRPVHVAAAKGDTESFRILMLFGADVAARTGVMGDTVIHIATEKMQIDFVMEVCQIPKSTCLIDSKNNSGDTAVHVASKMGSTSLISLLLQNGYKTKIPNIYGLIPVTLAREGHRRAIEIKDKVNWNMFADCMEMLDQFKDC